MSRATVSLSWLGLGFLAIAFLGLTVHLSVTQCLALLMLVTSTASTWCNRSWHLWRKRLPEIYEDARRERLTRDGATGDALRELAFVFLVLTVLSLVLA